jgi:hypothetical protein
LLNIGEAARTIMTLNLAYKFVAMLVMISEANFFCNKTGLSSGHLFTESDLRNGSHVSPPNQRDFGGSILTDQYFFGFGSGHLANFYKRGFMPQHSSQAIRDRNLELAKFSSLIDTNGAYQLATNWLAALGVDVPLLERKYRRNFIQWKYYPEGKDGPGIMLPVYNIEWRGFILRSQPDRETRVVSLTIFGATKELVEYHVLDDSLFLRPRIQIQIKDLEKLLAIPDEEFRGFDALQRSNLLFQFTGRVESPHAPASSDGVHPKETNPPGPQQIVPKLPGSPAKLTSPKREVHKVAPTPSRPAQPQPQK